MVKIMGTHNMSLNLLSERKIFISSFKIFFYNKLKSKTYITDDNIIKIFCFYLQIQEISQFFRVMGTHIVLKLHERYLKNLIRIH